MEEFLHEVCGGWRKAVRRAAGRCGESNERIWADRLFRVFNGQGGDVPNPIDLARARLDNAELAVGDRAYIVLDILFGDRPHRADVIDFQRVLEAFPDRPWELGVAWAVGFERRTDFTLRQIAERCFGLLMEEQLDRALGRMAASRVFGPAQMVRYDRVPLAALLGETLVVSNCTCGHHASAVEGPRCRPRADGTGGRCNTMCCLHRLAEWRPGDISLADFILKALLGRKDGLITTEELVKGLIIMTLLKIGPGDKRYPDFELEAGWTVRPRLQSGPVVFLRCAVECRANYRLPDRCPSGHEHAEADMIFTDGTWTCGAVCGRRYRKKCPAGHPHRDTESQVAEVRFHCRLCGRWYEEGAQCPKGGLHSTADRRVKRYRFVCQDTCGLAFGGCSQEHSHDEAHERLSPARWACGECGVEYLGESECPGGHRHSPHMLEGAEWRCGQPCGQLHESGISCPAGHSQKEDESWRLRSENWVFLEKLPGHHYYQEKPFHRVDPNGAVMHHACRAGTGDRWTCEACERDVSAELVYVWTRQPAGPHGELPDDDHLKDASPHGSDQRGVEPIAMEPGAAAQEEPAVVELAKRILGLLQAATDDHRRQQLEMRLRSILQLTGQSRSDTLAEFELELVAGTEREDDDDDA